METSEGVSQEQRTLILSVAAELLMATRGRGEQQNKGEVGVEVNAGREAGGDRECSEKGGGKEIVVIFLLSLCPQNCKGCHFVWLSREYKDHS